MSTLSTQHICFIGGGAMAEALIRGLVGQQKVTPSLVSVIDNGSVERLIYLENQYGITPIATSERIAEAIQAAHIIVLAVKPKDAAEAIRSYRDHFHNRQLLLSFVAGLSIATIASLADAPMPIIRTMPNTSSSIGLGATGLSCNNEVDDAQRSLAIEMFASIGIVSEVPEEKLDIVTGVSGSGPAYFYYFVEAMIAGGIEGGLSEAVARELTVQTILGAAEMLRQTGEAPEELRRKVTSPNGTTEAALLLMADDGVGDSVRRAVLRAAERAGEMGSEIARLIGTDS